MQPSAGARKKPPISNYRRPFLQPNMQGFSTSWKCHILASWIHRVEKYSFHISRIFTKPYVEQSTTFVPTFCQLRSLKQTFFKDKSEDKIWKYLIIQNYFLHFKMYYVDKVARDLLKNLVFTRESYRAGISQPCQVFAVTCIFQH